MQGALQSHSYPFGGLSHRQLKGDWLTTTRKQQTVIVPHTCHPPNNNKANNDIT
jgi:hypothetical protein